jgi:hypothetical protein
MGMTRPYWVRKELNLNRTPKPYTKLAYSF